MIVYRSAAYFKKKKNRKSNRYSPSSHNGILRINIDAECCIGFFFTIN